MYDKRKPDGVEKVADIEGGQPQDAVVTPFVEKERS